MDKLTWPFTMFTENVKKDISALYIFVPFLSRWRIIDIVNYILPAFTLASDPGLLTQAPEWRRVKHIMSGTSISLHYLVIE